MRIEFEVQTLIFPYWFCEKGKKKVPNFSQKMRFFIMKSQDKCLICSGDCSGDTSYSKAIYPFQLNPISTQKTTLSHKAKTGVQSKAIDEREISPNSNNRATPGTPTAHKNQPKSFSTQHFRQTEPIPQKVKTSTLENRADSVTTKQTISHRD